MSRWNLATTLAGVAVATAGLFAAAPSAAAISTTPAPATLYEINLGGATSTPTGPGSFSSRNGSVTIASSPLPTLTTTLAVGGQQDEASAFMRYFFRINGPENMVVPVSLIGTIILVAQAPDTGQANSYGQIDLTTNFTSDSGFIEIDRGGTVRGSVSQLLPTLHATTYTNIWSAITLRAGTVARGSNDGAASGSALVDPILTIDASYFSQNGYDPAAYSLSFSDGFGNGATAVPEPAAWAMMIAGFGVVGTAARRRRTTTHIRFA